jgi:HK97 family phage portal protein
MGIIQKLLGVAKKSVSPFSSDIYGSFTNNSGMGFFKRKDYLDEYKNWPYACITARAESVGDIHLKLMKNGKEVLKHPALDILDRVNPTMTKNELFEATQSFKDLDGNAFWFLAHSGEDGKGQIEEIYLLRPDRVLIVPDTDNPLLVKGYVYVQADGKRIPFSPAEIVHHKNFNPQGNWPFPHRGMGVIEAAHWAIDTDNEARLWNYKFFKNSARPDGILEYKGDGTLPADEYVRIKEQWKQEHQGADNAHKVGVLSGSVTWKEITRSQADMEFSQQRTFSRDEVLALFRTPKSVIGITDDVNRANADAAIYVFNLRTVKPLMQKLANTLNEFYLPEFEDGLKFEFVSPVPEDRVALTAEYAQAMNKWLTRNEIRALEGLPPTENGNTFWGTLADVEQDTAPAPVLKALDSIVVEKTGETGEKSEAEKAVDKFVAKMPKAESEKKQLTEEQKKGYIEIWKANIKIGTKPLEKKLKAYFEKQEAEVQKNLRRELKGLDAKQYILKGLNDIVFDEDEALSAGINLITPFLKDYIKRAGESAASLVDGKFDDGTKQIQKFLKDRATYFSETVNNTTREKILDSVQEGVNGAETIDQLSARVSQVFEEATQSRTVMIARTESSASANFAASQAYLQAGITQHEWVVVEPEDDDCKGNEGVVVKIGEPFPDGDTEPPVHPNCVCTTIPVF